MTDKRLSGSNGVTMRMFQSSCFKTQSSRLWVWSKVWHTFEASSTVRGGSDSSRCGSGRPVSCLVLPLAAGSSQRRTARGGARAEPENCG